MSLLLYIPLSEAILKHSGRDMPVIGIKNFTIEIERLIATYEVWVCVNDAISIVAASDNAVTNVISMTPTDMNESASFIMDGNSIDCVIKHYAYHSVRHAYLVKIEFPLMKSKLKTYIFEKNNKDFVEQTRFDILDL